MIYSFTIHRTENEDYLRFCNLGTGIYDEVEIWGLNTRGPFPFGRMVAHDVVEHSPQQVHAVNTSVEEELSAIGALMLTRWESGFDLIREVSTLGDYRPPELPEGETVNTKWYDIEDIFIANEDVFADEPYTEAQWAATHWVNEGRSRIEENFNGDRNKASSAFKFIEEHAQNLPDLFDEDPYLISVDIYADTDKKVWRETVNTEPFFDEEE